MPQNPNDPQGAAVYDERERNRALQRRLYGRTPVGLDLDLFSQRYRAAVAETPSDAQPATAAAMPQGDEPPWFVWDANELWRIPARGAVGFTLGINNTLRFLGDTLLPTGALFGTRARGLGSLLIDPFAPPNAVVSSYVAPTTSKSAAGASLVAEAATAFVPIAGQLGRIGRFTRTAESVSFATHNVAQRAVARAGSLNWRGNAIASGATAAILHDPVRIDVSRADLVAGTSSTRLASTTDEFLGRVSDFNLGVALSPAFDLAFAGLRIGGRYLYRNGVGLTRESIELFRLRRQQRAGAASTPELENQAIDAAIEIAEQDIARTTQIAEQKIPKTIPHPTPPEPSAPKPVNVPPPKELQPHAAPEPSAPKPVKVGTPPQSVAPKVSARTTKAERLATTPQAQAAAITAAQSRTHVERVLEKLSNSMDPEMRREAMQFYKELLDSGQQLTDMEFAQMLHETGYVNYARHLGSKNTFAAGRTLEELADEVYRFKSQTLDEYERKAIASLTRELDIDPESWVQTFSGTLPEIYQKAASMLLYRRSQLNGQAKWLSEQIDRALSSDDMLHLVMADAGIEQRIFLATDVRMATTSVSRTLNAQKILADEALSKNVDKVALAKKTATLQKTIEQARSARAKLIDSPDPMELAGDQQALVREVARRGGAEAIRSRVAEMKKVLNSVAGASAATRSAAVTAAAEVMRHPTFAGFLHSWILGQILTAPKTLVRVAIGQGVFGLAKPALRGAGALAGAGLSSVAGTRESMSQLLMVARSTLDSYREMFRPQTIAEAVHAAAAAFANPMPRGEVQKYALRRITRENVRDWFRGHKWNPDSVHATAVQWLFTHDPTRPITDVAAGLNLGGLAETGFRALGGIDAFERVVIERSQARARLAAVGREIFGGDEVAVREFVEAELPKVIQNGQIVSQRAVFERMRSEVAEQGIAANAREEVAIARERAAQWFADPTNQAAISTADFVRPLADEVVGQMEMMPGTILASVVNKVSSITDRWPLGLLVLAFMRSAQSLGRSTLQPFDAVGLANAVVRARFPGFSRAMGASHNRFVREFHSPDAFVRSEAIGRLATGITMTLSAMSLYEEEAPDGFPLVTGAGPASAAERKAMMDRGWLPNSIYLSGPGKRVQYDFVEPISSWLRLVANFSDAIRYAGEEDDADLVDTALGIGFAASQTLLDSTWNTQAKTFFRAISGDESAQESFVSTAATTIALPGGRLTTTAVVPVSRALFRGDDVMRDADGIVERLRRSLGLDSENPKLYGFTGNPIERQDPLLDTTPIRLSAKHDPEIDPELNRLRVVMRKLPRRQFDVDISRLRASEGGPSAYDRWAQMLREEPIGSRTLRESLIQLFGSERYQRVSAEDPEGQDIRSRMIHDEVSRYRSVHLLRLMREYPELAEAKRNEDLRTRDIKMGR